MRILMTRPLAESEALAKKLGDEGHDVIISPMLNIQPSAFQLPTEKYHTLVFTSRHAVAPTAQKPALRDLPVFCIGTATAEAATQAGFNVVADAEGDRGRLVGEIARHKPRHILFMSGADERGDIVSELAAAKVRATRCVVYRATLAAAFTEDAATALATNSIDLALLFSARSAATFAKLSHGIAGFDRSALAIACLSEAVAEAAGAGWAREHVSATLTTQGLLESAGLVCDSAATVS
jgi:uroporphyrinogen-III synthase